MIRATVRSALALCVLIACAVATPAATAHTPDAAARSMDTARSMDAARSMDTAADQDWAWPVEHHREIVDPFRAPAHAYGPGHRGMDVATEIGAVVSAPADGVVAFRGVVVDRPLLTIDHGGDVVTTFEPVESSLMPGDVVRRGQPIGTVAVGGHTQPGALHIGVRWRGEYVNPMRFFGDLPRAVLLPCC